MGGNSSREPSPDQSGQIYDVPTLPWKCDDCGQRHIPFDTTECPGCGKPKSGPVYEALGAGIRDNRQLPVDGVPAYALSPLSAGRRGCDQIAETAFGPARNVVVSGNGNSDFFVVPMDRMAQARDGLGNDDLHAGDLQVVQGKGDTGGRALPVSTTDGGPSSGDAISSASVDGCTYEQHALNPFSDEIVPTSAIYAVPSEVEEGVFWCETCRAERINAQRVELETSVALTGNPTYEPLGDGRKELGVPRGLVAAPLGQLGEPSTRGNDKLYWTKARCRQCSESASVRGHRLDDQHREPAAKGWCAAGLSWVAAHPWKTAVGVGGAIGGVLLITAGAKPKAGCSYGWGAAAMGCNNEDGAAPITPFDSVSVTSTLQSITERNPDGTITTKTKVLNPDGTISTVAITKKTIPTTPTSITTTTITPKPDATLAATTTIGSTTTLKELTTGTSITPTTTTVSTTTLKELTTKFELTTEVECLPNDPFCRRDRLGRRVRKADVCVDFFSAPDNSGLVGQVKKVLGSNFARASINYAQAHRLPRGRRTNEQFAQDWYLQWGDTLKTHCRNL